MTGGYLPCGGAAREVVLASGTSWPGMTSVAGASAAVREEGGLALCRAAGRWPCFNCAVDASVLAGSTEGR